MCVCVCVSVCVLEGPTVILTHLNIYYFKFFMNFFFFETELHSCCPGWSAMAWSQLTTHHNLHLVGSSNSPASASGVAGITGTTIMPIFKFFVEMVSGYIAQADIELLGSSGPPASTSQSAGIAAVSHHG